MVPLLGIVVVAAGLAATHTPLPITVGAGTRGRLADGLWIPDGVGGDVTVSPLAKTPALGFSLAGDYNFRPNIASDSEKTIAQIAAISNPSAIVAAQNDIWNARFAVSGTLDDHDAPRFHAGPTASLGVELRQVQHLTVSSTNDVPAVTRADAPVEAGPFLSAGVNAGFGPHFGLSLSAIDRLRAPPGGTALGQELGTQLDVTFRR